jgi:SAM-dependent methyltransferase
MHYLNLGCGNRFNSDWTNINFTSTGPDVIAHNLTQGIPCPDASFDVVYHSHLLEHFPKDQALTFLQECYRVLRPQGILRVVVPDLEQIARTYLLALERSLAGDTAWQANYDWILLELFDQAVRNQTGGAMANYLSQSNIPNMNFVIQRIGAEAQSIAYMLRAKEKFSFDSKITRNWITTVKHRLWQIREIGYRILLQSDYSALQIGRLRQSGEIHYQMYDQFSLKQLLEECSFIKIVQCSATQSQIPGWVTMHLDTEPDGSVYKPDSLFMEAQKP